MQTLNWATLTRSIRVCPEIAAFVPQSVIHNGIVHEIHEIEGVEHTGFGVESVQYDKLCVLASDVANKVVDSEERALADESKIDEAGRAAKRKHLIDKKLLWRPVCKRLVLTHILSEDGPSSSPDEAARRLRAHWESVFGEKAVDEEAIEIFRPHVQSVP